MNDALSAPRRWRLPTDITVHILLNGNTLFNTVLSLLVLVALATVAIVSYYESTRSGRYHREFFTAQQGQLMDEWRYGSMRDEHGLSFDACDRTAHMNISAQDCAESVAYEQQRFRVLCSAPMATDAVGFITGSLSPAGSDYVSGIDRQRVSALLNAVEARIANPLMANNYATKFSQYERTQMMLRVSRQQGEWCGRAAEFAALSAGIPTP